MRVAARPGKAEEARQVTPENVDDIRDWVEEYHYKLRYSHNGYLKSDHILVDRYNCEHRVRYGDYIVFTPEILEYNVIPLEEFDKLYVAVDENGMIPVEED